MALPKLNAPTYQITIPSTGVTTQYRPFLVKEQKHLMMAQESEDLNEIANTVSTLVEACTNNTIQANSSPVFDIEYIFLQIRSKSVGETARIIVTCPDDEKTKVPVTIPLDEVEVQMFDDHTNVVNVTDTIKIVMRYPTLNDYASYLKQNDSKHIFDMINQCVDEIHFDEKIYKRVDMTQKDVEEFIDQMNTEQFQKVTQFFETMPRLRHEIKVTNPNTKVESEVVLEGLQSFLG